MDITGQLIRYNLIKRLSGFDVDPAEAIQLPNENYAMIIGNTLLKGNQDGQIIPSDMVLHRRILLITSELPDRDHPEENIEVVMNMGPGILTYHKPNARNRRVKPYCDINTVSGKKGYRHGLSVDKPSLVWVMKGLHPEFATETSFEFEPVSERPEHYSTRF